ncbi:hypothetical protein CBS101457_001263 [Exobasidium rhododendri]|nr:hypothetical protein CBS101457_001263 [Exobasidium rhododendri]
MLYNKVPEQPDEKDHAKWANFLKAYQNGDWQSTGSCQTGCSKATRKVHTSEGDKLDNHDFFLKYKYLAAPPVPKEKCKVRDETLSRYGFDDQKTKPFIDRYVKHAKVVFKCDYASVSVACTAKRSVQFLSSYGAPSDAASVATNTLCDHAMLLSADEIFVIPDLLEDWRFQHFNFRGKTGDIMRFYASAPIMLSNSEKGRNEDNEVQVGRLTIMRTNPWHEFGETEADLLMDIAKMTQEALENEFLRTHALKAQNMQKEAANLSWHLNSAADEEMTQDTAKDSKLGVLLSPQRMQKVVDLLQKMVNASTVVAIDVTDFHLLSLRSDTSFSYAASPRSSTYSGTYPSMPWLSNSSSGTSQDSDLGFPPFHRRQSDRASDGYPSATTSPSEYIGTSSDPISKAAYKFPHSRSTSSANSTVETERYGSLPGGSINIIAYAGGEATLPSISSPTQVRDVGALLTKTRQNKKLSKPLIYHNINKEDLSSDDDEDEDEESKDRIENPLASLMTSRTKSYGTLAVFANDQIQPLFLFVVTFDQKKTMTEAERLFMYSIGLITAASSLRQQARVADRAQLDFIRSVQHELRTPLNGILGITDFLRQNLTSGQMTEKLDLTEEGLLTSLLESIRLSGVNLSTILDDVLDFGRLSGLRGRDMSIQSVEEVDLVREVEDGCLDDLEHIAMHERQDQTMNIYRGYYAVPTMVIKVAPELQTRFRTDRATLKKILSKFVANALRYSDEKEVVEISVAPTVLTKEESEQIRAGDRWIDFVIADTGMGMSQEFLSNSLFKPFSKADSFSQGVGLGVTIAASLISQMGGRLHIQSTLGKGTTVQVSLPLCQVPDVFSHNSLPQLHLPFQIKKASFFGFKLKGQLKIVELIKERLIQNGIQIVSADQEADLVILKETALPEKVGSSDDQQQQQRLDLAAVESTSAANDVNPPLPVGPKARVLVVARNALRNRDISILEGLPIWLFRPPFGPTSLDTMDEFLREESPVVLKSVPTPTDAAKENMKRVRESQSEAIKMDDEVANMARRTERLMFASNIKHPSAQIAIPPKIASGVSTTVENGVGGVASQKEVKPFRVLVVEDNYVNMRLITAVLQKGGYSYVEAKDGVEAVEQYIAFQPSIVLLDISLPLMDGFEACIRMRAHTLVHFPKIIAITALSSTEDKIRGLEVCGMDDWRTKPLSIKTLRSDLVTWKKDWEQTWSPTARSIDNSNSRGSPLIPSKAPVPLPSS